MKRPYSRESLWTVGGLSVLVAGFLFGLYLPGRTRIERLEKEIGEAERRVREFPVQLNNERTLKDQIAEREAFIRQARIGISNHVHQAEMIRELHELAQASGFSLESLTPQTRETGDTYAQIHFAVEYRGRFDQLLQFLSGLEFDQRAYDIESLTVSLADSEFSGNLAGALNFTGYSSSAENNESNGNAGDSDSESADRENTAAVLR